MGGEADGGGSEVATADVAAGVVVVSDDRYKVTKPAGGNEKKGLSSWARKKVKMVRQVQLRVEAALQEAGLTASETGSGELQDGTEPGSNVTADQIFVSAKDVARTRRPIFQTKWNEEKDLRKGVNSRALL